MFAWITISFLFVGNGALANTEAQQPVRPMQLAQQSIRLTAADVSAARSNWPNLLGEGDSTLDWGDARLTRELIEIRDNLIENRTGREFFTPQDRKERAAQRRLIGRLVAENARHIKKLTPLLPDRPVAGPMPAVRREYVAAQHEIRQARHAYLNALGPLDHAERSAALAAWRQKRTLEIERVRELRTAMRISQNEALQRHPAPTAQELAESEQRREERKELRAQLIKAADEDQKKLLSDYHQKRLQARAKEK